MYEHSSFLLINVGAPFLLGLAVGYFTKKALKVGLFLLGLSVVVLFVSTHYNIIVLNGPILTDTVEQGKDAANRFGAFLVESLSGLKGVGLSGCAGFFVGLKIG